jgi:hypothetical protein
MTDEFPVDINSVSHCNFTSEDMKSFQNIKNKVARGLFAEGVLP